MYIIQYHFAVVQDDIPKLDHVWRERIKKSIDQKLVVHPEIFGIPLRQSLRGHRKLRVYDYRVVFRIQGKYVLILAILHRSVVYREVGKRAR